MAANSTYKEFVEWARFSGKKALPPPMPKVKIKNGEIVVDGRKYEELPGALQKTIEQDFAGIYAIRSEGSEPVVTTAYDKREARALRKGIDALLKQMREKR
jgi:hypothetical protein